MTTIAANRKMMAGDTRVTGGGTIYNCTKIFRIGKSIIGVCGTTSCTTQFLAWFRRECPPDVPSVYNDEKDEFAALVLNDEGLFYYSDTTEPDEIHEPFMSIGSGAQAALTAMHCGKSPPESVRLAMRCDSNTGGKVQELHLLTTTKSKKSILKFQKSDVQNTTTKAAKRKAPKTPSFGESRQAGPEGGEAKPEPPKAGSGETIG